MYAKLGADQAMLEDEENGDTLKEMGELFAEAALEEDEAHATEIIQRISDKEVEMAQAGFGPSITQNERFEGFKEISSHARRVQEAEMAMDYGSLQ